MLGVGGVDLFCGRGHLQTSETRETRETRETSETSETMETNETQGKQRKTRGTPSINKRNTFQSMGFLSKQGQYFTVKWKRKAIASDGGYSVIGGRYCLLAWE